MVMEGCLLLVMHKLGPRRQIRLPGVMLNCVVIIAFPFVSLRRLALPCLSLPDKVFENYSSDF
jgi:hypothetical protein